MRGLVLVLFLIGMAMVTTASAQTEGEGPSENAPSSTDDPSLLAYFAASAEDPILAEVLAAIQAEEMEATSSAEILYGTQYADTIVYGDLVLYGNWGSCTGYSRWGRGMCIFAVGSSGTKYRGTFRSWAAWSAGAVNPLGIGGDPFEGPTWGSDYIYPADHFAESYIYCGSSGGFLIYVAMNYSFPTPVCGDGSAHFPADTQMEIRGDGGAGAGAGSDSIWGWNNGDTIMGDGGQDWLWGMGGADSINGDNGPDRIWPGDCTSGTEWLYGGFNDAEVDWITAIDIVGPGCVRRFYGGPGDDILRGGPFVDWMSGGEGNDTVCGAGGANTLYGGNGNDFLYATFPSYCDGGEPGGSPGDTCNNPNCNPHPNCETFTMAGCPL